MMVAAAAVIIDRPRGSTHPRYPEYVYPFDYGYLQGTTAGDGDGIDVWIGSLAARRVTGVICTVDLEQRDAEIKILLGCSAQDAGTITATHNTGPQAGLLIMRPAGTQTTEAV